MLSLCEATGLSRAPSLGPREELLSALQTVVPTITPLVVGSAHHIFSTRARGPARYYGSEENAAQALLRTAATLHYPHARVGVAEGVFAAQQAILQEQPSRLCSKPHERISIITPHRTREFLSPLPIERATEQEFAHLLRSFGLHTLGALAALPFETVRQRFGTTGATAFLQASAQLLPGSTDLTPEIPTPRLSTHTTFDTPLDQAEQLAFSTRQDVEQWAERLIRYGLICTQLEIGITDDTGVLHSRVWVHPTYFSASDVLQRLRQQAAELPRTPDRTGAGITAITLTPQHTAHASQHETGLWSTAPDARVIHQFNRLQSLLGSSGVATGVLRGGRLSADRALLLPWGRSDGDCFSENSSTMTQRTPSGPWPGHVSGFTPSRVYSELPPAKVLDRSEHPVHIDHDYLLTAPPVSLVVASERYEAPITAWSKPWPLREQWWSGLPMRFRIQLVLNDGTAWLLRYERLPNPERSPAGQTPTTPHWEWRAEGSYG